MNGRLLIRVIKKLPSSEQSSKGKRKTISTQTDKISQQPENWENRNDPDLIDHNSSKMTDPFYVSLNFSPLINISTGMHSSKEVKILC